MKAEPLKSEGARAERKAIKTYLQRQLRYAGLATGPVYQAILDWVEGRHKRYDAAKGGLGKK